MQTVRLSGLRAPAARVSRGSAVESADKCSETEGPGGVDNVYDTKRCRGGEGVRVQGGGRRCGGNIKSSSAVQCDRPAVWSSILEKWLMSSTALYNSHQPGGLDQVSISSVHSPCRHYCAGCPPPIRIRRPRATDGQTAAGTHLPYPAASALPHPPTTTTTGRYADDSCSRVTQAAVITCSGDLSAVCLHLPTRRSDLARANRVSPGSVPPLCNNPPTPSALQPSIRPDYRLEIREPLSVPHDLRL